MSLWEPCYNSNKDALSYKKTHIDNLLKDLRDSYIDYELKLSKETFNKDGYLRILDLMSRLLQHTIKSLEKGESNAGAYQLSLPKKLCRFFDGPYAHPRDRQF